MPRWRVDILRHRAERLGTVEAANEKEAIEKAAKEFDIRPRGRTESLSRRSRARIRPLKLTAGVIRISTRIEL